MVFDETTEEGILFQSGKFWGKMNFSGHHFRQIVLCIIIRAMPEYVISWVPGSGICLCQEDTGYPHDGRADNTAYRHDRRADKRRYPHDREIDIQMLKMSRNRYILS